MGWRSAEIRHNDTLQRLALRELGTAERWFDIANLNGLVPPYLASTRSDGVLAWGDNILLPIYQPDSIAAIDDPFLTDLKVDFDGFLMSDGQDLITVSGDDNLKQTLGFAVVAQYGKMLFHPEYGSFVPSLNGSINRVSLAGTAKFYASSAIINDPRVSDIVKINAYLLNDTISLSALIQPVRGQVIAFEKVL